MKKQITIDGEKSDWYEKAIFILKDHQPTSMPDNLFLYAEDIVEDYLKKHSIGATSKNNQKKIASKINCFYNISLLFCTISIIILLVVWIQ